MHSICISNLILNFIIESLKDAGGNLTEKTIPRHSQLAGSLGRTIDKAYAEEFEIQMTDFKSNFSKDLKLLTKLLVLEELFVKKKNPTNWTKLQKLFEFFKFFMQASHPEKRKDKGKNLGAVKTT